MGGAGGVAGYQQIGGPLHGVQKVTQTTGKQGTPINAHQHLPTLTQNKVWAPISSIPGGITYRTDGQRAMPTLTPSGLNRSQNSLPPLGQPTFLHRASKSGSGNPGNDRPHFPSQQVT